MARTRSRYQSYEKVTAKKRLSPNEVKAFSTPGLETIAIALEEEREAEAAQKAWLQQILKLAKVRLSHSQYKVLQLKLVGLKDAQVAQILEISIPAVRTARYEYRKRFKKGAEEEKPKKKPKPSQKRRPSKKKR